jgi:O-antigen/teichoic acid export membrane protein
VSVAPSDAGGSVTAPHDALGEPEAPARVIRGSLLRTLGYVVAVGAYALVLPFLFRHLGVVDSGRYVTVISLVTILAGIVEVGLTGVAIREYSVSPLGERHALMQRLLAIRISVFGAAAVAIIGLSALAGYPGVLLLGVVLASIGMFLENLGSGYGVWLATNLRFGWQTATNMARQLAVALLTALLVLLDAPLVWFFAVYIPAAMAQFALSLWVTWRAIPHLPSFRGRAWRDLALSSSPFVLAMAINVIYFRVPMIAMSLLASGRDTGFFGASFRIVETLTTLTAFVLTASLPLLARAALGDAARFANAFRRIVEVALLVGGALTVATLVAAPIVIEVVAGPSFGPSVEILQLLAVILLMKFASTALGFGLLATERYRSMLLTNIAAVIVAAAIGALTIGAFGSYGAIAAAFASEAALIVGYLVALRRAGHAVTLPLHTSAVVLAASAIGCATLMLPIPGVLAVGLAISAYLLVVARCGAIPDDVLQTVPGLSGRR